MKYLVLFISLLAFATSCTERPDQERDLEELQKLRKDFWGQEVVDNANEKATRLDSAYKTYIEHYPEDTLNPEFLFENARIHLGALQNPDQAIVLLQQVYKKYPDHKRAPEAIYQAGFVFENVINDNRLASRQYELLIEKYPDHPFAKQAQVSMKYLGKDPALMLKDILDSAKRSGQDTTNFNP